VASAEAVLPYFLVGIVQFSPPLDPLELKQVELSRRVEMRSDVKNCAQVWICRVLAALVIMSWPAALHGQISPAEPSPFTIYFAHYAIGMGYATTFTFVNTGTTTATGALRLWDPNGNPGTPIQISINPGGVSSTRMDGASIRTGWAVYEGEGGNVTGVATFEYSEYRGALKSIAGVPASSPLESATIAVDYDPALELETTFAIANPGTTAIDVTMEAFSETGMPLDIPRTFTLLPGNQIARYVHLEFSSFENFRGTIVFSTPAGGRFLVMTLAQNRGLYTVMPIAPGATNR